MQIMVEGLAPAAFGMMHFRSPHERLRQQITGYVMRDEARHVAFGVLSLEAVYRQMTPSELREREDFIIEAAYLMRDRLLMQEVWERLGYDLACGPSGRSRRPSCRPSASSCSRRSSRT